MDHSFLDQQFSVNFIIAWTQALHLHQSLIQWSTGSDHHDFVAFEHFDGVARLICQLNANTVLRTLYAHRQLPQVEALRIRTGGKIYSDQVEITRITATSSASPSISTSFT